MNQESTIANCRKVGGFRPSPPFRGWVAGAAKTKYLIVEAVIFCAVALVWWLASRDSTTTKHDPVPVEAIHPQRHAKVSPVHMTDQDQVRQGDEFPTPKTEPDVKLSMTFPTRWKGGNPSTDILMADSLDPGKLRDRLLLQRIQEWAMQAPDAARLWAEQRPDPGERDRLLRAIDDQLNGRDSLDRNLAGIVEHLDGAVALLAVDKSKRAEVENLTERWAGENLDAARDWVLSQPPGEIRDTLVHRIATVQAGDDPIGAARLAAAEIPPGPQLDEAVLTVVNQWSLQNPAAAAEWVNVFAEGPLKERAQQELRGLASYHGKTTAPSNREAQHL